MKNEILRLRSEGKTYNEIVNILGCAKGTVAYHCGNGQKIKSLRRQRKNRKTPFIAVSRKMMTAVYRKVLDYKRGGKNHREFIDDFSDKNRLIKAIINNPICYLTGKKIDLSDTKSYSLDHKIPLSRGGKHSLKNLGLSTRSANMAKHDMTPDEFIDFCKIILEYNGYKITPKKME